MLVAPARAERVLRAARTWLEGNLRLIASVIILLLAVTLLRNGISGLTRPPPGRKHARPIGRRYADGVMFWLSRNTFVGSYSSFRATSRPVRLLAVRRLPPRRCRRGS